MDANVGPRIWLTDIDDYQVRVFSNRCEGLPVVPIAATVYELGCIGHDIKAGLYDPQKTVIYRA